MIIKDQIRDNFLNFCLKLLVTWILQTKIIVLMQTVFDNNVEDILCAVLHHLIRVLFWV